ncbi:MAG: hypothetical protein AAF581_00980 [Planctomycetota bacterium]
MTVRSLHSTVPKLHVELQRQPRLSAWLSRLFQAKLFQARPFQNWLFRSRIWVAGAAAALTAFVELQWHTAPFSLSAFFSLPVAIVFCATVLIYGVDDLWDGLKELDRQPRLAQPLLVVSAFIALVIALCWAPQAVVWIVVPGLIACLGYGAPLFGLRSRIASQILLDDLDGGTRKQRRSGWKVLPGVKSAFVAVALTTAAVAIPWLCCEARPPIEELIAAVVCVFVITVNNATLFDVSDLRRDRVAGIPTLPVLIGAARTRCSLITLHVVALLVLLRISSGEVVWVVMASAALAGVPAITHSRRRADICIDGFPYAVLAVAAVAQMVA